MITNYFKCIFLVIFASIFMCSCAALIEANEVEDRNLSYADLPPAEPGKCYAKCLIHDNYDLVEKDILVFTGDDPKIEGVELQKIILSKASTEWTKKKADPNCISPKSADCVIWCLVAKPEVTEEYHVVVDTSLVKAFVTKTITLDELVQPGGHTEWKEVVCQKDVTEALYKNIQLALIDFGLGDNIIPSGKIGRTTKEALVKLQKRFKLPVGSINIETLDFLVVEY